MKATAAIDHHDLAKAWAEFLTRWDWQWFVTLTFPEDIHPEAADKVFRVWVSKINRALYGPRWAKKGKAIYWARALEYQKRGVIHFHVLINGVGDLRRLTWMDQWYALTGGYARIEAIKSMGAVTAYCAKYVVKDGQIELSKSLSDCERSQGALFAIGGKQQG